VRDWVPTDSPKSKALQNTAPFVPNNPADPRNRRVSITVLNQ